MKEISEADLRFAITYAVGRVKITPDKKRRVGETERDVIAAAILEHFRMCHWHVMHEPAPGFTAPQGLPRADD